MSSVYNWPCNPPARTGSHAGSIAPFVMGLVCLSVVPCLSAPCMQFTTEVPDSEDSEYAASNSLMEAREVEMGEKRFAYFVGAERPNP